MMMIRRLSARSTLCTEKVQSDVILHFSLTDETLFTLESHGNLFMHHTFSLIYESHSLTDFKVSKTLSDEFFCCR